MFNRAPKETKPKSPEEIEIKKEAIELEREVNALYKKLASTKESLLGSNSRLEKVIKFFDDHSTTIYATMMTSFFDPGGLALRNVSHGKWEEIAANIGLGIAVGQMLESIGSIMMEEFKKNILREELKKRKTLQGKNTPEELK
jgi:hypothetical protein